MEFILAPIPTTIDPGSCGVMLNFDSEQKSDKFYSIFRGFIVTNVINELNINNLRLYPVKHIMHKIFLKR